MKILSLALALLAVVPVAPAYMQTAQDGTWHARLRDTWQRRDGERYVTLQLEQDDNHRFGISIRLAELAGLNAADERWTARDVRFSLKRDAGAFDFHGSFTDGRGLGTYRFAPNAEFAAAMQKQYG